MGIAIGIDLGTTNSVTCVKKLNVYTMRNAEGEELTPSSVTAVPNPETGSADFVVGRHSRDLLKQYPRETITSVKRLMGRDFEDLEVQTLISEQHLAYSLSTDPSEPGSIYIALDNTRYTPEMISGLILKKLIADGEVELESKIEKAVVTVPAYFSDRQKFATRAACDYAGIKLLRLLPEPTAAALSFGLGDLEKEDSRTIMVFDLGGGTFDVSILSFAGGNFMEVTKGGDMWLGGNNIDQLLVEHILSSVEKEEGKPIRAMIDSLPAADKARFLVEIHEKAEAAKIALSTEEFATVEMFGLLKEENGKFVDIDVLITREEFATLLTPVVERVSQIAEQILHEIRFEPELIDTILMVGGSSYVPAIQDALRKIFGSEKVMVHPRPMLAIAEGAALMAAKMTTVDEADFTMMHSTAQDYYLQLADGKRHLIVARNSPLPITVEEELCFSHEDQELARLRVFNEAEGILDTVGELWFHKGDEDLYKTNEVPKLRLRFSVDEDNIITMKASSLKNEKESVEAQIARGGLAAKLYNDLERMMSSTIANCHSGAMEEDILSLSRSIVSTILSTTDPVTGATRTDQKQKAEGQIQMLKMFCEEEIVPLGTLRFAVRAKKVSEPFLSEADNLCLAANIGNLREAVDSLDDFEKFKAIDEAFDDFYDVQPLTILLTKADFLAEDCEDSEPELSKKVRKLMQRFLDAHQRKDEDEKEEVHFYLHDLVFNQRHWGSNPSGRFDRDVRL